MSDRKIFWANGDNAEMQAAFAKAQETFKYFWRELSWEYRRIIPALDLACVKIAFTEEQEGQQPIVEHMWINEVGFDGENISGVLINQPNEITSVSNGEAVSFPLHMVSDWLLAIAGETYGGFTIHAMRAQMNEEERREHDEAWGLNFGDFNNILIVNKQQEDPQNIIEHPMSRNTRENLQQYLRENPDEVHSTDELGFTLLHKETIAGNSIAVEILLAAGADKTTPTPGGKTALELARELKWEHIIPLLEK